MHFKHEATQHINLGMILNNEQHPVRSFTTLLKTNMAKTKQAIKNAI